MYIAGCDDGAGKCYNVGDTVNGTCYEAVCKISSNSSMVYMDVRNGGNSTIKIRHSHCELDWIWKLYCPVGTVVRDLIRIAMFYFEVYVSCVLSWTFNACNWLLSLVIIRVVCVNVYDR